MYKLNALRMIFFVLLGIAGTTVAHAQATRTWVSGVGDDANPCSRTAPCKTFAGAISKTASGGEINVLDPGGFGAVTITKAITIDGGGFIAGVLVSGTNGIVVSAGVNDTVVLRNLDVNGLGTGLDGIKYLSGRALHVENCRVYSFTLSGINFVPTSGTNSLFVSNTKLLHNTQNGISISTVGSNAAAIKASISDTISQSNGRGVFVGDHAFAVVRHSTVTDNVTTVSPATSGDGFAANATSHAASLIIDDTMSSNNGGAAVDALAVSTIRFGNMQISGNGAAFATSGGGTLQSFGNNDVTGNALVGPTPMVIPQS